MSRDHPAYGEEVSPLYLLPTRPFPLRIFIDEQGMNLEGAGDMINSIIRKPKIKLLLTDML